MKKDLLKKHSIPMIGTILSLVALALMFFLRTIANLIYSSFGGVVSSFFSTFFIALPVILFLAQFFIPKLKGRFNVAAMAMFLVISITYFISAISNLVSLFDSFRFINLIYMLLKLAIAVLALLPIPSLLFNKFTKFAAIPLAVFVILLETITCISTVYDMLYTMIRWLGFHFGCSVSIVNSVIGLLFVILFYGSVLIHFFMQKKDDDSEAAPDGEVVAEPELITEGEIPSEPEATPDAE